MENENKEFQDSISSMIKSNNLDDIKLAVGIISNNPDMVEVKDLWYNINDYLTPTTLKYCELYCKEDKSDKVYILVVDKVLKPSGYKTTAYYGRRGKTMRKDVKGNSFYEDYEYDYYKNQKIGKGYRLINEVVL